MSAGREMDLLIAEQVIGFVRVVDDTYDYHRVQHRTEVLLPPRRTLREFQDLLPRSGPIPLGYFVSARYSVEMDAALQVVTALRPRFRPEAAHGFALLHCLSRPVPPPVGRHGAPVARYEWEWCATFALAGGDVAACADTAPLAICRAALKEKA